MKKFIAFCKSYLAEILFAVLTLLLICGFIACWLKSTGFVVGLCGAMAMVLEICIAFGLSHLPLHHCRAFKITHYLCFILWAAVFVIGIIFSAQANKELLTLGTLSGVAFCVLFADLAVTAHLSRAQAQTTELPIATADACDDD